MKKETVPIVVFYILYFVWIFTVVYLTTQTTILNYFSIGVVLFYFLFLREKGDFIWFAAAFMIPLAITAFSVEKGLPEFSPKLILFMPPWLPLAWGTTIIALRKFYTVVSEV